MKQSASQLVLPLSLGDHTTFDTFWVGQHRELIDALRSSVTQKNSRLIFLYGPSGAGKSHLMFAFAQFAESQSVALRYLACGDPQITAAWLEGLTGDAIVCLDDADLWAKDETKERALFALFERIDNGGGQLIVSARQAPDKNDFLLDDLVSRLSSGLIYPLSKLNDEQQYLALEMRAKQKGLSLSPEVLSYLMSRSTRDPNKRFALLDSIDKASLVAKRRVTIPFLKTLLD